MSFPWVMWLSFDGVPCQHAVVYVHDDLDACLKFSRQATWPTQHQACSRWEDAFAPYSDLSSQPSQPSQPSPAQPTVCRHPADPGFTHTYPHATGGLCTCSGCACIRHRNSWYDGYFAFNMAHGMDEYEAAVQPIKHPLFQQLLQPLNMTGSSAAAAGGAASVLEVGIGTGVCVGVLGPGEARN